MAGKKYSWTDQGKKKAVLERAIAKMRSRMLSSQGTVGRRQVRACHCPIWAMRLALGRGTGNEAHLKVASSKEKKALDVTV
ncbi:hypothetical protein OS493_028750 [Desmophyllum pertusum]|uniref:Uncharacterized protein n=1 Tax=Desmophyllum pertusum TaxID=174260 RepID=A0A9X0CER2_9CNID|nr:hypothetical protein OS493_028750 [Desmophyllum pertusum]